MKKIVLVDDVQLHLLNTRNRLKKYYEVYPAQDAAKLFEILEHIIPDLILLDIHMPEVNGYQIIERLKSDYRFFGIPVIFLTGKDDRSSMIKGLNLGAVDFITKPITDDVLLERIDDQLDPEKQKTNKAIILAVDDSPVSLKEINHMLGDLYRVYTLREPEKVKDFLGMVEPDLFLLDYQMPGITGFELVPIIRSVPEHSDTPIIFLTAIGTVDNLSVAMHLGAADFIVKPIDNKILLQKVTAQLQGHIMRRRMREV